MSRLIKTPLLRRSAPSPHLSFRTSIIPLRRTFAASKASTSVPNDFRLRAIIALSLVSASIGLYFWEKQTTASSTSSDTSGGKFTLRLRGPGGVEEYVFQRKPESETEAMLHAHETSEKIGRKGNPVIKWDRSWLGSNEPPEDRSAIDMIPRGPAKATSSWFGGSTSPTTEAEGSRDLMMFSVLDGHAGDATSKLLAKALHPTIGLALASLQAGHVPSEVGARMKGLTEYLKPFAWNAGKAWMPNNIVLAIQNAFLQLDDNICQTPLRLLPSLRTSDKPITDATYPTPSQVFMAMSGPADAGACAISLIVDAENEDLYVALAGDCRAVAGWQDQQGRWRCDPLTEDQMGETPREIRRVKSEHPASESDNVIRNGRVQGGLQPTRAFGDASYKWTMEEHASIAAAYRAEGQRARGQRPGSFTPPYVTARPEVTYRKIRPVDGEALRFVVMATDGLWDRMTSEEATLLVGAYLKHQTHTDIPKTALPVEFPLVLPPPMQQRLYPAEDLPGSELKSKGAWVFEGDENAATHLIRNSLAGADRKYRSELLSMNGKSTRSFRDDVTVTVIFFGETG